MTALSSSAAARVAVLVASGFSEPDLAAAQKAFKGRPAFLRIVSMDQGLVQSWNDSNWGLNYAADQTLNTALAADYDALLVPGGRRSADKLKLTAHTKRFIGGFVDMNKPVLLLDEAFELLVFAERADRMVPENITLIAGDTVTQDRATLTGRFADQVTAERVTETATRRAA